MCRFFRVISRVLPALLRFDRPELTPHDDRRSSGECMGAGLDYARHQNESTHNARWEYFLSLLEIDRTFGAHAVARADQRVCQSVRIEPMVRLQLFSFSVL